MLEVFLVDGGIVSEGVGNGIEGVFMESGVVVGICMDIWDDVFMFMISFFLIFLYVVEGMFVVIDGEWEVCERVVLRLLGFFFSCLRIIWVVVENWGMYVVEGLVLGVCGVNLIVWDGVVLGVFFGVLIVFFFGFFELDMMMICGNICFVRDWLKELGCDFKLKVV